MRRWHPAGAVAVAAAACFTMQAACSFAEPSRAPSESSEHGAPREGERFKNRLEPSHAASLYEELGLWWRKTWTSLIPRQGAAPHVQYDAAAIQRMPSITWIGHATFLVRMDGVAFVTDPMFSERASPLSFVGPSRLVPPGVPLEALPPLDFALLSHDHFDHADESSVRWLAWRGVPIIVPLGLGAWVRAVGGQAIELDWWQSVTVGGVTIHCVPARHFSGRGLLDKNRSLWAGWVVSGASRRFYHAGDTGYSPDATEIRRRLGAVDLAAVPIGAYLPRSLMRDVHVDPEEALRIGLDVGAKRVVGMHFGTFDLADEPLDEPPRRFLEEAARQGLESGRAWILKVGETRGW